MSDRLAKLTIDATYRAGRGKNILAREKRIKLGRNPLISAKFQEKIPENDVFTKYFAFFGLVLSWTRN